jgi:hypothetical protein
MYFGSVLWLSVIIITIAICLWAILDVSRHIAAISAAIRRLDRKAEKKRDALESKRESLSNHLDQYAADQKGASDVPELGSSEKTIQDGYELTKEALTKQVARWES